MQFQLKLKELKGILKNGNQIMMFQQDKFLMKLKVTRLDINKKNLTKPSSKKKKLIVKRSKDVSESKIFEKITKPSCKKKKLIVKSSKKCI